MGKSILIAEDQLIIAKVNAIMLNKEGYETIVVSRAEDAITHAKAQDVDAILMDIKFKSNEMDGVEAAKEIRTFSEVPIIFTSGNSPQILKDRISNIKNTAYLSKPIHFEKLKQILGDLFCNLSH